MWKHFRKIHMTSCNFHLNGGFSCLQLSKEKKIFHKFYIFRAFNLVKQENIQKSDSTRISFKTLKEVYQNLYLETVLVLNEGGFGFVSTLIVMLYLEHSNILKFLWIVFHSSFLVVGLHISALFELIVTRITFILR